eukprot:10645729-Alexandrium_andersonii.AAC.1
MRRFRAKPERASFHLQVENSAPKRRIPPKSASFRLKSGGARGIKSEGQHACSSFSAVSAL